MRSIHPSSTNRHSIRQANLWTALAAAAVAVFASPASAQHASRPTLHVNPRWKECSFQLDPVLTQTAWRQFTGEAGDVIRFRPLVGADPMGAGRFELSLMQWTIGIDDHDAAWNDTFVHPDSTHWLFEGSGLPFPGLAARVGVTDRMDVGAFFTKNPNANYGVYGVQLQRGLYHDPASGWSAAARVSHASLFGPEDLSLRLYGLDLVGSREVSLKPGRISVAPYAGVAANLSRSHEKSAVVDLEDENSFGVQGTLGAAARIYAARAALEYSVGRVPSVSIKVGLGR